MWSSQLWLRLNKQSQIKPEKCFRGFNRIRTRGLCVSAAVLHQLSYEDPNVGSRTVYWLHRTRERNETYQYYVNGGQTSEKKMWSHLHFICLSAVHIILISWLILFIGHPRNRTDKQKIETDPLFHKILDWLQKRVQLPPINMSNFLSRRYTW